MSAPRPLQNRVDPFGDLVATTARGALMGNRCGRLHNDDQTLGTRRWTSPMWIACVCEYKGHHREIWGKGYSELFFLDEPTALAAGHRPCFLCRSADAKAFQRAFDSDTKLKAAQMDKILHEERLDGRRKRTYAAPIQGLPDGAMIEREGRAFAMRGSSLLPWSFEGYGAPLERPRTGVANVLTPPSIVRALLAGYAPRWAAA